MGLSARKRVRLGPVILNTSASSRGPNASLSLGTQNRKKGQLNVTYNSKRGLTVSLYGTGIKWKSTKKGIGKTGLTKSQISENSRRKKLYRSADKAMRDRARKREKEVKQILKLSAKVEAKTENVVASILRKINSARASIIEGFDIDIDKLKSKNTDAITKAQLIEKFWEGKNLKIRKLCEKRISGVLSSDVFSEFDFSSVNARLINEMDVSEELEEEALLITPAASSLEWVIDKDTFKKLLTSSLYEIGFEALQIEVTSLINQFVVDCVTRNAENCAEVVLSKFGLSSNFFDYSLFDYDDPSTDYLMELSNVGLVDEIANSALTCLSEYTAAILEDGVIDDDELETISLIFARFARLLRCLRPQISKDYYDEFCEKLSRLRIDLFLTGTSLLFSDFSEIEFSASMKSSDLVTEVIAKYEYYRSIFGKKSDLEDLLPLKGTPLTLLEETNQEIERSIIVYLEEINSFYEDLLSSVSEFEQIKENIDDLSLVGLFDQESLFEIIDETISNSAEYSEVKNSALENKTKLTDRIGVLVEDYFSTKNEQALNLVSQFQLASGSLRKERKIVKKIDDLMKEYSNHSYLMDGMYHFNEYKKLKLCRDGSGVEPASLLSTNKKNGIVSKSFGAVYKLGKFCLKLLLGLAILASVLRVLGITD